MIKLGEGVCVGERDLLTGRSCIIAQSGAGKSYGVAVICEALAEANLGFCIIDVEGEYHSLKQAFDVLVVGGEDGVSFSSINFDRLAHVVISDGVPLVLDLSEVSDLKSVVNEWVNALYKAADELRIPYLLIVEEADKFIPQQGDKLSIFQEVAQRGRKRGLGLLIASQRPAMIDKSVLSQCNHQLIGKLTVKNDLQSINHFFNDRAGLKSLPDLLPGEFFLIGFKPKEELFKFRERVTIHESDTPDIKERLPARIKDVINVVTESNGLGVKPKLSLDEVRLLASRDCRRKYLLFGEREEVFSLKLVNKPLLELNVKVKRKRLFQGEWVNLLIRLTNDLRVVDESFKELFDLSFLKDLSTDEVKILIGLLYEHSRTINNLVNFSGLTEPRVRGLVKDLISKDLVLRGEWRGKDRLFKPISIDIPRLASLGSGVLRPSERVSDEFVFDLKQVNQVLGLLGDFELLDSRVLFYPFYEVVLKRGVVSRELLINAVTGDLC